MSAHDDNFLAASRPAPHLRAAEAEDAGGVGIFRAFPSGTLYPANKSPALIAGCLHLSTVQTSPPGERMERRRRGVMNRTWTFILAVVALIAASACGHVQTQNSIPPPQIVPPLTGPQLQYFQQNPQEFQQLRDRLSQQAGQQPLAVTKLAPAETPSAGSWTTLTNSPGVTLQNPLLLTDGTVIASQECTGNWYRLTPDQTGSYINGTWSQIASLPSGYAPLFHGSGVLPDGRVIIEGGEYNGVSGNCGSPVLTSNAAIYDPVANVWTSVSPPSGWSRHRRCRIGHPR